MFLSFFLRNCFKRVVVDFFQWHNRKNKIKDVSRCFLSRYFVIHALYVSTYVIIDNNVNLDNSMSVFGKFDRCLNLEKDLSFLRFVVMSSNFLNLPMYVILSPNRIVKI